MSYTHLYLYIFGVHRICFINASKVVLWKPASDEGVVLAYTYLQYGLVCACVMPQIFGETGSIPTAPPNAVGWELQITFLGNN